MNSYKLQPIMRNAQGGWALREMCRDLREYLMERNAKYFIEIGSFQGESSEIFAQELPFMNVLCIDPWKNGYDELDVTSNADMTEAEANFDYRTKYLKNIEKLKGISTDWKSLYPAMKIDMVYIDGLHSYEGVKADIEFWLPKMIDGGIVAGHDYYDDEEFLKIHKHVAGVKRAVNESFGIPDKVDGDGSWFKRLTR